MTAAPERLVDAGWLTEPPTATVLAALSDESVATRVVGGAVRNSLLGLAPGDIDMATTAEPADVMARAADAGMKAIPTGLAHGTVTVVAAGVAFEVTTLRHDVETHGRHATVAFGADWEADARRRDFTMNALYADADGRLHDPLGGYGDLMARRVRFIGDPTERIREDYLRILRFFRFHAQYGAGPLDAEGLGASIRERLGLLRLSGERLRQEMLRLLPAPGAAGAVEAMADSGLLALVTGGVAYRASFQRMMAITADGAQADAILRLAALAVWIVEDAHRLAARLRLSRAERDRLVSAAERWWRLSPALGEAARKVWLYRLGRATYRERALLARARSGRPDDAGWHDMMALAERWEIPVFPVRGGHLVDAGLAQGAAVGDLLARLEREWISGGFVADRAALLVRARELADA